MVEVNVYKQYYVYALINPITNKCFYIGCGKVKNRSISDQRIFFHYRAVFNNSEKHNKEKISILKQIVESGYDEPRYRILFQSNNKDAAFKVEKRVIKLLGHGLTNIAKGGLGGVTFKHKHPMKGKTMPDWWVKKLSEAKKGKPSHRKGAVLGPESIAKIKAARAKQVMHIRVNVSDEQAQVMIKMYKEVKNKNAVARHFKTSKFITKRILKGITV
jgi:hypothetical protein